MVVLVDLLYDVKDGKLYIGPNKGEPINYEQGTTIKINEKTLSVISESGEVETKDRLTNYFSSIVGQYKYRHYTGAIAYEQYSADGLLKLRIPMSANGGCYYIEKNNLSMTNQKDTTTTTNFKVSANTLMLTDNEKTYSYNFVNEGVWYQSDEIDYKKPIK